MRKLAWLVFLLPAVATAQTAPVAVEADAVRVRTVADGEQGELPGSKDAEKPTATPTATTPAKPVVPANALPPSDAPTMWIDRNMSRSWETSGPRPFFATTIDVGYLYLRPRVSIGYGRPFHKWFGIDANPTVQNFGFGAYAGLRLDIPYFDIRAGARYFGSFQRSYLRPDTSYDRYEMESTALGRSRVLTLETEANLTVPVGPGSILALGSLSYLANVPEGLYVYEETLRVMVAPPWVWRARGGYMFGFGAHQQFSIGPAVDLLGVPERGSFVVRVGGLVRFVMSRSFELRGAFMPSIHSQDSLGLLESDFTELGLRWRWATSDPVRR